MGSLMHFLKYDLKIDESQKAYSKWQDFSLTEPSTWTQHLYDPFLLSDMSGICEKLVVDLTSNKRILIYGDYDLDGMSASSALFLTLKTLRSKLWQKPSTDVQYNGKIVQDEDLQLAVYIPDRVNEGYSLSQKAVNFVIANGYDLVITVDCGIKSTEKIAKLVEANIEVIITDHHECPTVLPKATFVLNPKRHNEKYPNTALSGSAVVFKLVQALEQTMHLPLGSLTQAIVEIVALGLISDVMDLNFENWQIIRAAFNKLQKEQGQIGLATLLAKLNIERSLLTYSDMAFLVCPKFNACGRIADTYLGLLCLVTTDKKVAESLADNLIKINAKRQNLTEQAWQEAEDYLYAEPELLEKSILCVPLLSIHSGIVGLVAARLQAKYLKPSICFTTITDDMGNELLKGSGRSYGDFNMYAAISNVRDKHPDLFVTFGGHKQAVGLTIYKNKFSEFNQFLNENVQTYLAALPNTIDVNYSEKIEFYDAKSTLPSLSMLQSQLLEEPFGPKRNLPSYLFTGDIVSSTYLGAGKAHVKLNIATGESLLAFNQPQLAKLLSQASSNLKLILSANLRIFRNSLQAQYLVRNIYLVWSEEELLRLRQSLTQVSDLRLLDEQHIYKLLAEFYKILKIYGVDRLFYLDTTYFGLTYFPLLAGNVFDDGKSFFISQQVVKQCLQIFSELNIIKYYKLTDKALLLKMLDSKCQPSLQNAPTFVALAKTNAVLPDDF